MFVKFTVSIGFVGARHTELFEFDDDTPEEEIEEMYLDWRNNYLDGGWYVLEEN